MNLYQRILGTPFVYEWVRPLAVGGIDMSPLYRRLGSTSGAVVLDVGCGTGDAMKYLTDDFEAYVGVDTDPVAVDFARKRYGSRPRVSFEERFLAEKDIEALAPTHVVLAGLMHHLTDEQVASLLASLRRSPRLVRIVTQDIVYLRGKPLSNLFASLDRGRHCRKREAYESLCKEAGLDVEESGLERSHPYTGLAWYLMMTLSPRRVCTVSSSDCLSP